MEEPTSYVEMRINETNQEPLFTTEQLLEMMLGPRHRSLQYTVSITVLYSIIFLTAMLGNLSTCIVIARRPYMRTATNCYLFSLAVSDMVTILVGMPPEFWTVWEQYPWPFGNAYCVMKCFLSEITSYASVLTIQLFTIERWLAVCYPMESQIMVGLGRSVKLLVLIWLVAILSALPFVFFSSTIMPLTVQHDSQNVSVSIASNFTQSESESSLERIPVLDSMICATNDSETMWRLCVISAVVFFLVPLVIITTLYSLIAVRLRKSCKTIKIDDGVHVKSSRSRTFVLCNSARPSNSISSVCSARSTCSQRTSVDWAACGTREKRPHAHTDRIAALRILVTVIVVFFVSYAPYHCQRILGKFAEEITVNVPHGGACLDYLFYVSGILYYVSATVNPVLYNMVSKRYRRAFLHTFHELFNCKRGNPEKLHLSSFGVSKTSQIMGSKQSICTELRENLEGAGRMSPDELLPPVCSRYLKTPHMSAARRNSETLDKSDYKVNGSSSNGNFLRKSQSNMGKPGRFTALQFINQKSSDSLMNSNIPRIIVS